MAHTFDTKLRFTGSSAPLTANYTCGAGSTVLALSLVVVGTTARSGGAPTFNGVAMTQAGTTRGNATGYETGTELWYLLSPPTGAAYQISIPNGGTAKTIYAIASTYKSATGVSALDVANGNAATTGANPSVSVTTTANGDVIVASMGNGLSTAPTGRTGTSLYETDDGSYSDSGQYLLQATAGAQAMGWTIATDDWCICVAAFKEVPLAKSGTATIAGGGPITGVIRKTAVIVAAIGILGHVLATGFKAYPLILSGGGTVAASVWKSSASSSPITGGGTVAGTGAKSTSGNLSLNTYTDDFNREDCEITYGPWTQYWDAPAAVILNRFTGTSAGYKSAALYTGVGPFPNDQKAEYVLVSPGAGLGGGYGRGVIVRASGTGGYYVVGMGPGTLRVTKALSGNPIFDVALTLSPGDRIALEAVGASPVALNLYQNDILRWTYQDETNAALSGTPGVISITTMTTSPTDDFKTWIDRRLRGGGSLTVYGAQPEPPHYGTLTTSGGGVVAVVGVKGLFTSSYVVVRDNFDRADEDPLNPAIWTPIDIGFVAPLGHKVSSQKAVARKNGDCVTLFMQAPTSRSQYVQATMSRGGMFYNYTNGLLLKDDAANTFGFRALLSEGANDAAVRIYLQTRIPAYPYWTTVENLLIEALPSPAILRLEVDSSNTVRVYVNGILRITRPNPSWEGSPITGQAGIYSSWPERTIDNFELGWAVAGFTTTGGGIVAVQGKKGGLSEPSAIVYAQDDFNRANGQLGANWSSSLAVIYGQNVRESYNADTIAYWVGAGTFEADQSSEVAWPDVSSGNAVKCGPAVRIQDNGNRRYQFQGSVSNLKGYAGIYVVSSGTYLVGGWHDSSWIAAGSKVRLKVVGNVLSVYVNGSLWYSATDANNRIPSGGVPGIYLGTDVAVIDDFISEGDTATNVGIVGGGTVASQGEKEALADAAILGGGTIYASAREEAYRAAPIHGGGAIVLAFRKEARSFAHVAGNGTVAPTTRMDALGQPIVTGNGSLAVEFYPSHTAEYVWALVRGGGEITVTYEAAHSNVAVLSGGGRIDVQWVRSWPYIPTTPPGVDDATAIIVKIHLSYCGRTFGTDPCFATGEPCYNTWPTCKYIPAYQDVGKEYKFCLATIPQVVPDARPYILDIRWLPTEITTNLTVNGRIVLEMADEEDADVSIDPYWSQRASHPGTFWKKMLARNKNYKGRIVEVFEGRIDAPESNYVKRWVGRLSNVKLAQGKVTLESTDLLKDLTKIEVPPKTNAKTAAAIDAGYLQGVILTDDVDIFPSSGYVRIDDEIIRYESKDDVTKQLSTLTRAQFGTMDVAHNEKTKAQPVRYFEPKSGFDHLLDMMLVDAGMSADNVDLDAFAYWKEWPCRDINFTAVVSEPVKLSDLFFEVVDLLDSKVWVAESLKVTIRRNIQNHPGREYYPITDDSEIKDRSGAVDLNEASRVTRISYFWHKLPLGNINEYSSYRRLDIAVDPDAETNYDGVIEKVVLSRWIDPTIGWEELIGRFVRNIGLRRVTRQRDAQPIISIEVPPKNSSLSTGDYCVLSTDEILEPDGTPLSRQRYQIIRRERKGNVFALKMIRLAQRRICIIAPSGTPDYGSATEAQKEYGFVSDSGAKMSDGTEGYFIW